MDNEQFRQERRKQAVLRRLGTNQPHCVSCGESDWRCLELHHLAGRAYDAALVILCRNCHRKISDPDDNRRVPLEPPLLERVGQFLLGLAILLADLLVPKLQEFGAALIEAAQQCPAPWGYSPRLAMGE